MEEEILTVARMLGGERYKSGILKCRLLHMDGNSVVQPDLLLSTNFQGQQFYVPHFFDPNAIGFFDNKDNDFCRFTMVVNDEVLLRIGFFAQDRIKLCGDGAVFYKCHFSRLSDNGRPKSDGTWRKRGDQYQLQLFHHTNDEGLRGINNSREVWGSRRNIQGNLWLENIAYGYFTSLKKIQGEGDINSIAMSSSGLTGLVPTNAPYHAMYANRISVPQQAATDRARTIALWVDCELLAPNHLWLHRPLNSPAYYEVVLPKVFRAGIKPGCNLRIDHNEVRIPEADRRQFRYVIVGDADTELGLKAPFHEEETTQVAAVEAFQGNEEIIECWKRLSNTNQFDGKNLEYVKLKKAAPPVVSEYDAQMLSNSPSSG